MNNDDLSHADRLDIMSTQLRSAVRTDPWPAGTVLRFVYKSYDYLALKAHSGQWFTTSARDNFVPLSCDYETLLAFASEEPDSVRVATEWQGVISGK